VLSNARFVVQQGGWERTVAEKCKRVHAMVRGEITAHSAPSSDAVDVTYNPYVTPWFRERRTDKRIDATRMVWFSIKDGKPVVRAMP
jgi:hypothetical protein